MVTSLHVRLHEKIYETYKSVPVDAMTMSRTVFTKNLDQHQKIRNDKLTTADTMMKLTMEMTAADNVDSLVFSVNTVFCCT